MNALAAKKWTKRDIATLKSQLDGAALSERLYHPAERIKAWVQANRQALVVGGLKASKSMLEERAQKNAETALHFQNNPAIYGESTPEMVSRFNALAADDQKAASRCASLIARVESGGLPSEVSDYTPA